MKSESDFENVGVPKVLKGSINNIVCIFFLNVTHQVVLRKAANNCSVFMEHSSRLLEEHHGANGCNFHGKLFRVESFAVLQKHDMLQFICFQLREIKRQVREYNLWLL